MKADTLEGIRRSLETAGEEYARRSAGGVNRDAELARYFVQIAAENCKRAEEAIRRMEGNTG